MRNQILLLLALTFLTLNATAQDFQRARGQHHPL